MHYPTSISGFPPYRPGFHVQYARPMPMPMQSMHYRSPSSSMAPVFYVIGSFTLMLVLAAVMSMLGTVAAQAILDEGGDGDPPAAEQAITPSAALGR